VPAGPGFSLIANQLNTTNNNISPLLDSQLLDGNHIGVEIFKYNPASGGSFSVFAVTAGGWSSPAAQTTTLNPGEGAFIYNPFTTNFTLTFVGTVMQGTLNVTNVQTFNLISSIVPQSGALDTALGDTPLVGDEVFLYANGSYQSIEWNGTAWSSGSSPIINVGEGFFYYTPSATGQIWSRTFNVN